MTDPNNQPTKPDMGTDDTDFGIDDEADSEAEVEDGDDESTLRISVAVPDQAEAVYHVLQLAFAEQATLNPPSGVTSESLENIMAAIESGQTIVALLDDELVGTLRYNLLAESIYLGRLGVLPEHRRSGVGTALVGWCQEVLAPAEGRRAIDVEVRAALPSNVSLFRGLGFTELGSYGHPRNPKVKVRRLRWRAK